MTKYRKERPKSFSRKGKLIFKENKGRKK